MSETHFSTLAVHAGEEKRKPHGALTTPIVQTSTYTFADTAEILDYMRSKVDRDAARRAGDDLPVRDEYGRYSNPTQNAAERKLAALEGGDAQKTRALLFSSGMAAITNTILSLLRSGDHLILVRGCYRRTSEFANVILPRWGIDATLIEVAQPDQLAAAVRPNTKLILAETPTNPYLRVMDLANLVEVARAKGIVTAIDATFGTPINLRPLALGVDLVIHSASKYLGGHNDLLAGAVIGPNALLNEIENLRGLFGGVTDPQTAYLLIRGLKTLDLRVLRQNENGQRVAEWLETQPKITRVYYPGLPSHPDHEIARRQMTGFGGVVSFEIKGDRETTSRFVDALQLPYIGPTLGGVESIVQQQALFISLKEEERRASGISDTLVRYALGIENAQDIIADLEQALDQI
ncbi:MAG: aminotransferase class I/II-fold pyridoxal phosphate-dependent enzyme [Anaerolineae bacterium]|nr:aminotransferase class I/II-fold pyridoxal phosphate-dependent enzyme [Anaerolineae bacterium]